MAATIIETAPAPYVSGAIDPITLEVIENALRNARIEMDATSGPHRDVARHSRTGRCLSR